MRINEVKDDNAKVQTIVEYIQHIGCFDYERVETMLKDGDLFKEMAENDEPAVWYEQGGITPADNLFDLADEMHKIFTEGDVNSLDWMKTCIENGMNYAADKGWTVTSVDDLADGLREDGVGFDDDGNLLLIG